MKSKADESEFERLVHENVDLVFGTALRCLNGNEAQAEDVVQSVFLDLSRRLPSFSSETVVPGWLYQHARFLAWRLIRTEQRRQVREGEAMRRMLINQPDKDFAETLRPVIDQAMAQLREPDRDLVVLRFFRGYSLRKTGRALGISEDAARMRVNRAVDRLREQLKQMGVVATPSGLSLSLAALAGVVAPSGLAQAVLAATIGTGAVASSSMATASIAMMKTKSILTVAAVVVGIAAPVGLKHMWDAREVAHQETVKALRAELAVLEEAQTSSEDSRKSLSDQLAQLEDERRELFRLRGEVSQLRQEKAARDAKGADTPAVEIEEASSGTDAFGIPGDVLYGHVNADLGSGETLVTGGWPLGEDRSGYLLVAAEINEGAADESVVIRTRYLEGSAQLGKDLGLTANSGTEGELSSSALFTSSELEDFLSGERESGHVEVVESPMVMARAGNEAAISTQRVVEMDGETVFVGKQLRIMPAISEDGSSVNLDIHSEWNLSDAPISAEVEDLPGAPTRAMQASP